jgi:hypothetical protein
VIFHDLVVDSHAFEVGTGWAIKPDQGACKAELCVPLPSEACADGGQVDVRVVAGRLGMPLVHDASSGVSALGPETELTGRALSTAVAPELELPDVDGNPFKLSSLLGKKVLLVAWASW